MSFVGREEIFWGILTLHISLDFSAQISQGDAENPPKGMVLLRKLTQTWQENSDIEQNHKVYYRGQNKSAKYMSPENKNITETNWLLQTYSLLQQLQTLKACFSFFLSNFCNENQTEGKCAATATGKRGIVSIWSTTSFFDGLYQCSSVR